PPSWVACRRRRPGRRGSSREEPGAVEARRGRRAQELSDTRAVGRSDRATHPLIIYWTATVRAPVSRARAEAACARPRRPDGHATTTCRLLPRSRLAAVMADRQTRRRSLQAQTPMRRCWVAPALDPRVKSLRHEAAARCREPPLARAARTPPSRCRRTAHRQREPVGSRSRSAWRRRRRAPDSARAWTLARATRPPGAARSERAPRAPRPQAVAVARRPQPIRTRQSRPGVGQVRRSRPGSVARRARLQ